MSQTVTLRESPHFLLEEMVDDRERHEIDRLYWITNRGPHNFADYVDVTISKGNHGLSAPLIIEDLLEAETEADFNRLCMVHFNCSGTEANRLYPAAIELPEQPSPPFEHTQRLIVISPYVRQAAAGAA